MNANQHGAAFIIVVVIMLIMFTAGMAYLAVTKVQSNIASNQRDGIIAFYGAEAALSDAMNELVNDFDQTILNSPYTHTDFDGNNTDYQFSLTQDGSNPGKVTIIGTGTHENASRTVAAEVLAIVPFAATVITSTGGDFTISGSPTVTLDGRFLIGGDYTAGGSAVVISANASITDGIENFTVGAPSFTDYESNAGTVYPGDATFDTSGTPYAGIHYVKGDATVNSNLANVVINGTIVCDGAITIQGSNSISIDPDAGGVGYAALISSGSITVNSGVSLDIDGFVYAGGNIDINGTTDVDGQIALDGNLTISSPLTTTTVDLANDIVNNKRPRWWNYDDSDVRLSIWRGH